MQLKEIMTTDVVLIAPTDNITKAAQMMRDQDIGMIPVGENDRLIGSITDRDIVIKSTVEGKSPALTTVRDVMSGTIIYGYEDDSVDDGAETMRRHKVRRLPVINRDKRLVGIISIGDIAKAGQGVEKGGETLAAIAEA